MVRRRIVCVYQVSLEKLGLSNVSLLFCKQKRKVHGVQECNFFCVKGFFPFLQENSSRLYAIMSLYSMEFFGGEQYK